MWALLVTHAPQHIHSQSVFEDVSVDFGECEAKVSDSCVQAGFSKSAIADTSVNDAFEEVAVQDRCEELPRHRFVKHRLDVEI